MGRYDRQPEPISYMKNRCAWFEEEAAERARQNEVRWAYLEIKLPPGTFCAERLASMKEGQAVRAPPRATPGSGPGPTAAACAGRSTGAIA